MRSFRIVSSSSLQPRALPGAVADLVTAYSLLSDEKPDGISVTREDSSTKGISLNLNLNILVDVARIIPDAAALWFAARISPAIKRGVKMYLDGKLLPPDEANTIKMIKDAID